VSIELMFLLPSVLFMLSLFTRSAFHPANAAAAVVAWYATRLWTLWIFLLGLPFAALVIGYTTLLGSWRDDRAFRLATVQMCSALRTHVAMLLAAVAAVMAAAVLMVVVLHMAAN